MSKKLYIKTYGCQMNVYDSTRMADVLAPLGYSESETPEDADLVILNTCHIREKASEKMYSDLGRMRLHKLALAEQGKRSMIAVAGCVAQAEGEEIIERAPYVDMVVGPQSYHSLPELIAQVERTNKSAVELEFVEEAKFDLLPESLQPQGASAFVSIQEGCDKFCTFCVVPYTRGAEFSRPLAAIMREVETHVQQGAIEITLLGQNVNAYHGKVSTRPKLENDFSEPETVTDSLYSSPLAGEVRWGGADKDAPNSHAPSPNPLPQGERASLPSSLEHEVTLAQLLHNVAAVEGVKRIRYTTSHPRDMSDELIAAHGAIKTLMPMLHLPVQSGSDRILKAMNRKHTAADYITIVEKLRAARPDMAFSSDFIVGFPGETDADFEDTLKLVETVGFAASYVFAYSPRPGTPAANKDEQVPDDVAYARMQTLMKTIATQQLRFNRQMVGTTQPVLIERLGRKEGQVIGKTPFMQSVVLENAVHRMGTLVDVAITEAYEFSLKGEIAVSSKQLGSSSATDTVSYGVCISG